MMAPTHTYTMKVKHTRNSSWRCRSPCAAPAAQLDSGRQDDGALPGGTGAQTLASSSKVFIYWPEAGMQNLGPVALPHGPKGRALGDYSHARHPRGEIIVG